MLRTMRGDVATRHRGQDAANIQAARSTASQRLIDWLFRPVDGASLAAFRVVFAAIMLCEVGYAFASGHIRRDYLQASVLFPYELFPFVRPWPGAGLYVHFALMGLGAAGLLLGWFYRGSAALFLITYGYAFLLDKGNYNNHYYLIILLAGLLLVVDANRWAAIDQVRRPRAPLVPFWQLAALRAQIVLVFVYGGIAKLNPDWLAGEPMRTWLAGRSRTSGLGSLLAGEPATYFFTYGGLLFDLSIGFLLLWPRALPFAFVGMLAFNLTNHWLFHIGVFPFLMIGTVVLFAEPDLPRRLWSRLSLGRASHDSGAAPAPYEPPAARQRAAVALLLAIYFAGQLLIPLRHWLYPSDVSWTEEGHRFSWHMKLRSKHGQVLYWVTDPDTQRVWRVDPIPDLTLPQRRRFKSSPDMILHYAQHLKAEWQRRGVPAPIIRADAWLSLNRRPPQALIDGTIDLAAVEPSLLAPAAWIVPLDQRGRPGTVPIREFNSYGLRPRRVRVQEMTPSGASAAAGARSAE